MRLNLLSTRKRLAVTLSIVSALVLVGTGTAGFLLLPSGAHAQSTPTFQSSHFNQVAKDDAYYSDDNEGAVAEAAANQAYPATSVAADQMQAARQAFSKVYGSGDNSASWNAFGPSTTNSSAAWTYTGVPFGVSGRVTALGIGSVCRPGDCRLYLGAAGGGVWRTDDALAATPAWTSVMNGLFSNAIGSIWVDPSDASHVLVGTGEPNGSGDSEAGLGLYQTWNAGGQWAPVIGSFKVAAGRSIGGVAVDPSNPRHIFIGTAVARHGSSSVNGGRFTPPSAPQVGLYESTNGGATFSLVFSQPSDSVNPASATGGDFFRGGITKIVFDPTTAGRIYFSMFDYGLFRSNGKGGYEQAFASAGAGLVGNSAGARTEFALAPGAGASQDKLRIYVGDTDGASPANFYRTDDANVPAASIAWQKLSSSVNGTPGFASYNFCSGQCSYDMPVATAPGHPDVVYIGGQMQYGEFFGRSNGRAVQHSTDAGVSFTDMTNDQSFHGMHPDQHALVVDPENPGIVFAGSDGGIVRTSGQFGPDALPCSERSIHSSASAADCAQWLSAVPTQIVNMNAGLSTLQFQSVAVNPNNLNDVIGGTQDNGTLYRQGNSGTFSMQVGGDGGQSGINVSNTDIRFHSYYGPNHDVNFHNGDPMGWDWISDPLGYEAASFYVPMVFDPNQSVANTMYEGEQHVWRTTDNGGDQATLDAHCGEFNYDGTVQCGDWQPLGGALGSTSGDLTGSAYGNDKGGSYVVALARAAGNTGTMWAGTRRGRLFITTNADASDPNAVKFVRIDTPATPTRFISGIALDPTDPNHAFVSFSGYDAYATAAGTATGHLFEVRFNGTSATWTDLSAGLGDQPLTGVAYDQFNGDVYVSTDFGILRHAHNNLWVPAGHGLPMVAVYGMTLAGSGNNEVLYAATHGRGVYTLNLSNEHQGD